MGRYATFQIVWIFISYWAKLDFVSFWTVFYREVFSSKFMKCRDWTGNEFALKIIQSKEKTPRKCHCLLYGNKNRSYFHQHCWDVRCVQKIQVSFFVFNVWCFAVPQNVLLAFYELMTHLFVYLLCEKIKFFFLIVAVGLSTCLSKCQIMKTIIFNMDHCWLRNSNTIIHSAARYEVEVSNRSDIGNGEQSWRRSSCW